jgi:predicted NBD/HSP70 family sugar kinase
MLDLKNIRIDNLSQILHHLHFNGEMRRAALSEELGIRLNSMSSLMEELQEKELITPTDPNRPRSPFKIDHDSHWLLAIKTGKDGIHAHAITLSGKVLLQQQFLQTQWEPDDFVDKVSELRHQFVQKLEKEPLGVGVAMTGIIKDGQVKRSLQFGPWHQVELKTLLEDKLGLRVVVENDTRCALNGEQWFHLKDLSRKSIFAVALGHGVSSAMILKGELHLGGQSAAGEIGHVPVENQGRPCLCGKSDCLEAYCKTEEVLKQVNEILANENPIKDLDELLQWMPQHPGVSNVIDRIAQLLCKVLLPIIAALDTDALMVISESSEYSELITRALNRYFDQRLIGHEAHGIQWLPRGKLTESCCLGAAALILKEVFLEGGEC